MRPALSSNQENALMPATVVYKILNAGSAAEMENKMNEAAGEGWTLTQMLGPNLFGSAIAAWALMERKLTAKEISQSTD
jgi:hypothetical protein